MYYRDFRLESKQEGSRAFWGALTSSIQRGWEQAARVLTHGVTAGARECRCAAQAQVCLAASTRDPLQGRSVTGPERKIPIY
jgi:hypothetical protein